MPSSFSTNQLQLIFFNLNHHVCTVLDPTKTPISPLLYSSKNVLHLHTDTKQVIIFSGWRLWISSTSRRSACFMTMCSYLGTWNIIFLCTIIVKVITFTLIRRTILITCCYILNSLSFLRTFLKGIPEARCQKGFLLASRSSWEPSLSCTMLWKS